MVLNSKFLEKLPEEGREELKLTGNLHVHCQPHCDFLFESYVSHWFCVSHISYVFSVAVKIFATKLERCTIVQAVEKGITCVVSPCLLLYSIMD